MSAEGRSQGGTELPPSAIFLATPFLLGQRPRVGTWAHHAFCSTHYNMAAPTAEVIGSHMLKEGSGITTDIGLLLAIIARVRVYVFLE